MGSRLRSAAPSAAGALTEADFKKAFDNTPAEKIMNAKLVPARLAEINAYLIDANKDWSTKARQLSALRGVFLCPIPKIEVIVADNIPIFEKCLVEGLKELRSSLLREYCITIAFFCAKLGSKLIRPVELMFQNLMNLVQNSAKIMSSSGVILSEFIARYVHHSKLITLASGYLVSKSSGVRRSVVHMFDVILSSWETNILENHINVIKEVIKSGLNDADLACRSTSRDAYFAFYEKFPTQANELYESLDSIRQRALNDQKSAASSTQSILHEKDSLNLVSLRSAIPTATQNAFLDNRSRSDVHFRYNGGRGIPRVLPSRSRNNSPTRVPQVSRSRPNIPKPSPSPAPKSSSRYNMQNVQSRINTNLRPQPSATVRGNPPLPTPSRFVRPNGVPPSANPRPTQASAFGPTRSVPLSKQPSKPPSSALQTPRYTRPNIVRTPTSMNQPLIDTNSDDFFTNFNSMNLNSNSMTQSNYLVDFTSDHEGSPVLNGNGTHISPVNQTLRDITAHANADVDLKQSGKILESLTKLTDFTNTGQITLEQYAEHFNGLFLYCVQLLRIPDASNELRMASLDALRSLIDAQPDRIHDKAELALFRVLDSQDRDDATLTKAAEDCGASIIRYLNVEKCKELLLPLISNHREVNPLSVASSLKLLCRKIESLPEKDVKQLYLDTRDVVVKTYTHQESMVRRAAILFFVTVSNAIGTEPLRPYLQPSIFKLVEVYRDKAAKKPEIYLQKKKAF